MHPSIKIVCLVELAILLNVMRYPVLLVTACGLLILLMYWRASVFLTMLKRMRWLLLSMLMIFAFNTPGQYISAWPFEFAPTYEGLEGAALQCTRLCIMLAGLALLRKTTTREGLMAGFFLLLQPLRFLGLDPERFTARLWLTLHYVEQAPPPSKGKSLAQRLSGLQLDDSAQGPESITLELPPPGVIDMLTVLGLVTAAVLLL